MASFKFWAASDTAVETSGCYSFRVFTCYVFFNCTFMGNKHNSIFNATKIEMQVALCQTYVTPCVLDLAVLADTYPCVHYM